MPLGRRCVDRFQTKTCSVAQQEAKNTYRHACRASLLSAAHCQVSSPMLQVGDFSYCAYVGLGSGCLHLQQCASLQALCKLLAALPWSNIDALRTCSMFGSIPHAQATSRLPTRAWQSWLLHLQRRL